MIDPAEIAMPTGQVGRRFAAIVTDDDDEGARIQLRDLAVAARLPDRDLDPGDPLDAERMAVDAIRRLVTFRHSQGG